MTDTQLIALKEQGDHSILQFQTETLDFRHTDQLREEWHTLRDEVGSTVILDMSQVNFIDSSGLSFLHTIKQAITDQGGTLDMEGIHGQVKTLIELTRFSAKS